MADEPPLILVRLAVTMRLRHDAMIAGKRTRTLPANFAGSTGWPSDEEPQHQSARFNFSIEQIRVSD